MVDSSVIVDEEVLKSLQDVMGDDFALLLQTFAGDAEADLENLAKWVAKGDAQQIRQTAHSLKGISANLGAVHLSTLSLELEKAGRQGQLNLAETKLIAIEKEYERVKSYLHSHFSF